jgi:hypothetical protein
MRRTKSGKKFGVELLIDDATLRAIGLVSAQWGVLEIEFDVLLGILVRFPAAASIVPRQIPQAFDRRAKLFRIAPHWSCMTNPVSGMSSLALSMRPRRRAASATTSFMAIGISAAKEVISVRL